jgi:hypothetical protein
MTARTIAYWITTALITLAFAAGGAMDLSGGPEVVEGMRHLGYPAYVALLLGTWKLLGALAIGAPGMPRLKEWAYAGMFFDLTGAAVSHAAVGDGAGKASVPLAMVAILVASYVLRPDSRKFPSAHGAVGQASA